MTTASPLLDLTASDVVDPRSSDVGQRRERLRRDRLGRYAAVLWLLVGLAWWRALASDATDPFALPHIDWLAVTPILFFLLLALVLVGTQVATGRSPHVAYRPEEIDVRLRDVVGIDSVKDEVIRSLNLFLSHDTFAREMGGRPRRGLLFEGPPGTGKTHTAKALAAEAGVPFLFASASSFQSSYYGATARKVRSYFRALRTAARKEGGAIGFIDEFDAIAGTRRGLEMSPAPRAVAGCGGLAGLPTTYAAPAAQPTGFQAAGFGTSDLAGPVVNELLVQLQSFDEPPPLTRLAGGVVSRLNLLLPAHRQLRKPVAKTANILLVASTNRADGLDPALMRPGRLDRRLTFDAPGKSGRAELLDHYLSRKAHAPELDDAEQREALAAVTTGYTPAMIEGLLDEALVNAVRRGAPAMDRSDIEDARLTTELGIANPTAYTDHERRLVATHESGHAVVAHLTAPERRLELLSIVKRRASLGLLAHGDVEDVYTRSRSEMLAFVRIAFGGHCAEDLFFGDVSTGPGGDLLYATNVAAEMVGSCGMADTLVSFAAIQASALADTNVVGRVLADSDGRAQVESVLRAARTETRELLAANRDLVAALRDALLERGELIGREITDVLDDALAHRAGAVVDVRDDAVSHRQEAVGSTG